VARLAIVLIVTLTGCASPRAVLVNDQGEHLTCAATSAGLIGSIVAQSRFDGCVTEAKAKGYRVQYEEK
jgi:hypothetical protein